MTAVRAAGTATAEHFEDADRSTAVGIITAGPGLGAIIAPPIIVGITLAWDWRAAFVVTGALGFVWLAFWVWLYPPVPRGSRTGGGRTASGEPAPTAPDEPEAGRTMVTKRGLLLDRRVWGLMLSTIPRITRP